jgi:dynein heavy chain 1, cytosolic
MIALLLFFVSIAHPVLCALAANMLIHFPSCRLSPCAHLCTVNFRKAHEQLRTVIVRVLRPTAVQGGEKGTMADPADQDAIEEVNLAYEDVKSVDVLDISPAGTQTWENAKRRYEERIDRVENRITTRLRDQLATAKNGSEMFRIFGKFNALFVRPHIRGAIREYQVRCVDALFLLFAALL